MPRHISDISGTYMLKCCVGFLVWVSVSFGCLWIKYSYTFQLKTYRNFFPTCLCSIWIFANRHVSCPYLCPSFLGYILLLWCMFELFACSGLLFSVLITGVITDAIKDAVGRPRPDFFWRCFPNGKGVRPHQLLQFSYYVVFPKFCIIRSYLVD